MKKIKILFVSTDSSIIYWYPNVEECEVLFSLKSILDCKLIWSKNYDYIFIDLCTISFRKNFSEILFLTSFCKVCFIYDFNHKTRLLDIFFPNCQKFSRLEAFPINNFEREIKVQKVKEIVKKEPPKKIIIKETDLDDNIDEFHRLLTAACNSEEMVLLLGESGSGKSFYAKYIHEHSSRRTGSFKKFNSSTITTSIAESLLFGTEKYAYTDADECDGFLRSGNQGTIFFDEVGEMPIAAQSLFLTFLDDRVVYPLGNSDGVELDVRMIFATNKDIPSEIKRGNFRQDLYNRINVITIFVPPLRYHKQDIEKLVHVFIEKNTDCPHLITNGAMRKLKECDWRKKNVRGLKDTVKKALAVCKGCVIKEEDIMIDPAEF